MVEEEEEEEEEEEFESVFQGNSHETRESF